MKSCLQIIISIIILTFFSCKEPKNKQITDKPKKKIEINNPENSVIKPVVKKKKVIKPKHYEYLFVIAKSGLNYRDKPKGNILNKFPLNTQLKIIEYTKIPDQIKEGEKIIKGEWVGVEKDLDTVYVFNGFLSSSEVKSNIKLYSTSSYNKSENGKVKTAFLNISDTYFGNTYAEIYKTEKKLFLLNENSLSKDTLKLNKKQREKFLSIVNISELDKVFIFNIINDNVKIFDVIDLPTIACVNIFASRSNGEFDYEFGFDLGKDYIGEDNLTFIGKENPFQTGKIKPLIWDKIENINFPIKDEELETDIILETFTFSLSNYKYYIQSHQKQKGNYSYIKRHHLVVKDTVSNSIIYENNYYSSESVDLCKLLTKDIKTEHSYSWTGKIFKNKLPIIYGIENFSFGCPSIEIIDKTEPLITVLCDNRH